jgi:hypothetical protein
MLFICGLLVLCLMAGCVLFTTPEQAGNLSIAIGGSGGRAIEAGPPQVDTGLGNTTAIFRDSTGPADFGVKFSSTTVTVKSGNSVIANQTFTGSGPFSLAVPQGSGYTVELDAKVDPWIGSTSSANGPQFDPKTFATSYGGTANNVTVGSSTTVKMNLSMTGTMLIPGNGNVYYSWDDLTNPESFSNSVDFYDKYGRAYVKNGTDLDQYISPFGSPATDSSVVNNVSPFVHAIGTDHCFYFDTGGYAIYKHVFNSSPDSSSAFSRGLSSVRSFCVDESDNLYFLETDGGSAGLLEKVAFGGGVIISKDPGITGLGTNPKITFINGQLYIAESFNDAGGVNFLLHAYDRNLNEQWVSESYYDDNGMTFIGIAGSNRDTVYLSYQQYGSDYYIVAVDLNSRKVTGKKGPL